MSIATATRRAHFIDELRGFIIIYIVLYHLIYDLYLFGFDTYWLFSSSMSLLRDCLVTVMVIISGISSLYSHSNFRRGFKVLGCGLAITLITYLFMPSQLIIFGILHFFGTAMIIYALVGKLFARVNWILGFITCMVLFFLTFNVYYGYLGIEALGITIPLPDVLYSSPLLFPLGFSSGGLYSADYYPLMPWLFAFFAGTFIGVPLKNETAPAIFYNKHLPTLSKIGKHTLLIYLVHQPLIYGILTLFCS